MRMKYGKLVINLKGAVYALVGGAEPSTELEDRLRTEAYAVFEAAGIPVASPEEDAERRVGVMEEKAVLGQSRGGNSSWQSLVRGAGSIETDYLNGEIVLLGRLHGVPTPVNGAIQQEARRTAVAGGAPASMSMDELMERVLAVAS